MSQGQGRLTSWRHKFREVPNDLLNCTNLLGFKMFVDAFLFMCFWMFLLMFVYTFKKQESLCRAEGFSHPKNVSELTQREYQLPPINGDNWCPGKVQTVTRGEVVGAIRSSHFSVDPARYVECIEMNLQTYSFALFWGAGPYKSYVVLLESETDGWGWNHWRTKSFINFDGTKPPLGRVWFFALPQMLSINKIM